MSVARVALLMTAMVLLGGCIRKKPAVVALPAVPQPAAPVKPLIPELLSIPQTQIQLPSPQPIDPRALATIELPAEPLPPGAAPSRDLPPPLRRNVPPPTPGPLVVAPPKPAETPAVETPPPGEGLPRLQ